ncbi:MAG: hypothetical protein J7L07_07955, partial [Candidatus Odinarchaeota archaeon]|nr:hypothetical protein [Candidatus Odinarchaeota archaeon]
MFRRLFIFESDYKKLSRYVNTQRSAIVIGSDEGVDIFISLVLEYSPALDEVIDDLIKKLNADKSVNLKVIAHISEGVTIAEKSMVKFVLSGDDLRVYTINMVPLEIVRVDDKVRKADLSKDFELKEEIIKHIENWLAAKALLPEVAKVTEEEKSLLLRMALFSQRITLLVLIPLMVLAAIIVMPFRILLGKKFRIKGRVICLKDTFTFVEGMYNLLLSIESIPEVIVRKRFGIKPKSRKIDITERGRRPDYIINKYVTQLIDNSLGIVVGIYLVQHLEEIKYYFNLIVSYIKLLINSGSGYISSFLTRYPWLVEFLSDLWLAIYNFYENVALFITYLWINYISYIFIFIIDFLIQHPISLAAVILVIASTGVSGLLNVAADLLTIIILPIKIIYKIIQGIHYWVVY